MLKYTKGLIALVTAVSLSSGVTGIGLLEAGAGNVVSHKLHRSTSTFVMQNNVNVGCPDDQLLKSVQERDLYGVQSALSHGANVDTKDSIGWTPLHHAVSLMDTEMVRLLLAKGATVNTMANNGWSPLHLAVHRECTHMAELLLDAGGVVNNKSDNGNTPLHLAAKGHKIEMVKLLLIHDADMDSNCNLGRTPLDVAQEQGSAATAQLLQEAKGARGSSEQVYKEFRMKLQAELHKGKNNNNQ